MSEVNKVLGVIGVVNKGNHNPDYQYKVLNEVYGYNGSFFGSFRSVETNNTKPLSDPTAWAVVSRDGISGEVIHIWVARAFLKDSKVHKDGLFYEALENTTDIDVPGVSPKWNNISNPVKTIELRRYAKGEVVLNASEEQFVAVRDVNVGENLNSPDAFKKIALTGKNTYNFSGKFKNN